MGKRNRRALAATEKAKVWASVYSKDFSVDTTNPGFAARGGRLATAVVLEDDFWSGTQFSPSYQRVAAKNRAGVRTDQPRDGGKSIAEWATAPIKGF